MMYRSSEQQLIVNDLKNLFKREIECNRDFMYVDFTTTKENYINSIRITLNKDNIYNIQYVGNRYVLVRFLSTKGITKNSVKKERDRLRWILETLNKDRGRKCNSTYYYVDLSSIEGKFVVIQTQDSLCTFDDKKYKIKNYFLEKEEADKVADKLNKAHKFSGCE